MASAPDISERPLSTSPNGQIRLATSLVIEQNVEWLVGRRCLSLGSLAALQAADHTGELHHVLGLDSRAVRSYRELRQSVRLEGERTEASS